jgi:hypothetical protein
MVYAARVDHTGYRQRVACLVVTLLSRIHSSCCVGDPGNPPDTA